MSKRENPHLYGAFVHHLCATRRSMFSLSDQIWTPPTDVFETEDRIVIRMEIAGVETSDIEITAQDRQLIIRGRRREPAGQAVHTFHVMELHYGEFERIFDFPFRLTMDDIKASYQQGLLCVEAPKRQPNRFRVPVVSTAQKAEDSSELG